MRLCSTAVTHISKQVRYGYFNIIKRRNTTGSFLPLYNSRVFEDAELNEIPMHSAAAAQRYKEYLPFMIMGSTSMFPQKLLITKLEFNPTDQVMRIVSLRGRGPCRQEFSIKNIVPMTYGDMRAASPLPEPWLPTFIDETMVYYNRLNRDIMIFEDDGVWNQQTVNHPKLSLQERLDERQWFDRTKVI